MRARELGVFGWVLASAAALAACSDATESPGSGTAGAANGGAPSGGSPTTAGSPSVAGTTSGGAASGGTPNGGSPAAGATTGGASGAPSAGASSGGQTAGGSAGSGGVSGGGGGSAGSAGSSPVTCPSEVLKPGDANKTMMSGGNSRSYTLHVPAAYDGKKAVPLIIDFHGLSGNGGSQRTSSPYPAQTDADGVIMAFPTGLAGPSGNAWNVGPCCVKNTDDVAFAKALVAEVSKTACIDPKRVYAVGFSMGGGMSHYLACHAADTFAAVAPAAFDLLEENIDDCKPSRPITVVSFRGTSDPIVNYAGGESKVVTGMPITFLGAKTTLQKWGGLNKCSGSPSAEDGNGCSSYSGCQDGVDVMLCTKQGGGHEAGNAKVAWPILKKHTLP